jgi:hypothetical protein
MVVEVDLKRNIAVRVETRFSLRGEVVCRIEAKSVHSRGAVLLGDKPPRETTVHTATAGLDRLSVTRQVYANAFRRAASRCVEHVGCKGPRALRDLGRHRAHKRLQRAREGQSREVQALSYGNARNDRMSRRRG